MADAAVGSFMFRFFPEEDLPTKRCIRPAQSGRVGGGLLVLLFFAGSHRLLRSGTAGQRLSRIAEWMGSLRWREAYRPDQVDAILDSVFFTELYRYNRRAGTMPFDDPELNSL
jgi:hypothetical protein